eukprot:2436426-Karenia_brevis.AAC.1
MQQSDRHDDDSDDDEGNGDDDDNDYHHESCLKLVSTFRFVTGPTPWPSMLVEFDIIAQHRIAQSFRNLFREIHIGS